MEESQTTASTIPASTWTVDRERSTVELKLRHLVVATVRGRFASFAGTLDIDEAGPQSASGAVHVATIDTGDATRDERLRGAEFFDCARYPEIRFASSSIESRGDRLRIVGELTIKDRTREIELLARRRGAASERLELEVSGELRRSEFGIESAELLEAGISDRVELALHLSLVTGA